MLDYLKFKLVFEVRNIKVETEDEYDSGERIQLSVGDTVLWTEPGEAALYYDQYGDGGRSLVEALEEDVIGPALSKIFVD